MNKLLNGSLRKKLLLVITPIMIAIPIIVISIFLIKPAQSSSVTFVRNWGSFGFGEGEFDAPIGVAVNSSGDVYVVDTGNSRIQKFDSDGNFILEWGSNGSEDGQFDTIQGIATDDSNNVYVTDSGNSRIQKFDSEGTFLTKWGSFGSGDGEFDDPAGIAVDKSGYVYVAEEDNNRIQKFDSSGTYVTQWGSFGGANGEFNMPFLITIDAWNNIYVVEQNNNRVQKFDSDGNFIIKWGASGSANGELDSPKAIAIDPSGYVYVTDYNNSRVQIFDLSGNYITQWGSLGTGNSQFDSPLGIAANSSGDVYVVDSNNNRISEFTANIDIGSYSSIANDTTYIGSDNVDALIKIGSTVYLGGKFGMEAVDSSTGQQITWAPSIPDDPQTSSVPEVYSLAYSSTTQTLYAGSSNGILSFDVSSATGSLNSWTPEIEPATGSGNIYALAIVNDTLYAGGEFTGVDTQPRINLAAFDISTPGGVLTSWTADTDSNTHVYSLKSANSLVYVGGDFTTIQGVSQPMIAAFDPTSGDVDPTFNPVFDTLNNPFVKAIAYNNGTIYAGGHFDTINSVNSYANIASLSATTGLPDSSWVPSLSFDVHALATKDNYLYVGESDEVLSNGTVNGGEAGAFNMQTGAQADWDPQDNQGIHAMIPESNALYVGLVQNFVSGSTFKGSSLAKLFQFPVAYADIGGIANTVFLAQFDLNSLPPTPTPQPTSTPTPVVASTSTPTVTSVPGTVCSATKPGNPADVTISSASASGQLTVSWTAAPSPVTDYSIVYSDDQTVQKWGVVSTGNVTSYTVSGLNSGTTYYFWVNAINECMPGDQVGPATLGGGAVSTVSTPSGTLISTINADGTINSAVSPIPATGPLDLVRVGSIGIILMIVGAALLLAL